MDAKAIKFVVETIEIDAALSVFTPPRFNKKVWYRKLLFHLAIVTWLSRRIRAVKVDLEATGIWAQTYETTEDFWVQFT